MAYVKFTSALNRFFPELRDMEVDGETIGHVLKAINREVPGLTDYLLEEDGSLRKHVNVFIKEELINDRNTLSDLVGTEDEILIYQALSGG